MLLPLLCSSCILLFLLPARTYSQNDPFLTYCSGDTNFTTPSPYKTNLDVVLANLTASNSSYYSIAASSSSSASAAAYGLAQCLPDVSLSNCSDCLNRAAAAALHGCPNRTSAAVRFDICILRYSDKRFFSHVEDGQSTIYYNMQNATDPTVFDRRLTDLMGDIMPDAAAATTRFAVGFTNYSGFNNIYAMAQCTRDLTAANCSACLNLTVGYLQSYCHGKIGGRVFSVSCAVRFETYPFFPLLAVPPPPPTAVLEPPPTPPPIKSISPATDGGSGGGGGKDNSISPATGGGSGGGGGKDKSISPATGGGGVGGGGKDKGNDAFFFIISGLFLYTAWTL